MGRNGLSILLENIRQAVSILTFGMQSKDNESQLTQRTQTINRRQILGKRHHTPMCCTLQSWRHACKRFSLVSGLRGYLLRLFLRIRPYSLRMLHEHDWCRRWDRLMLRSGSLRVHLVHILLEKILRSVHVIGTVPLPWVHPSVVASDGHVVIKRSADHRLIELNRSSLRVRIRHSARIIERGATSMRHRVDRCLGMVSQQRFRIPTSEIDRPLLLLLLLSSILMLIIQASRMRRLRVPSVVRFFRYSGMINTLLKRLLRGICRAIVIEGKTEKVG